MTPDQANYDSDFIYAGGGETGEYRVQTVPVKAFEANPWGLYQVHGNVWEWCEDEDNGRRVLRGGCWDSSPGRLRAACRDRVRPQYRDSAMGFRVARTLTP